MSNSVIVRINDTRSRWTALIDSQGWGDQFDGDIDVLREAASLIAGLLVEKTALTTHANSALAAKDEEIKRLRDALRELVDVKDLQRRANDMLKANDETDPDFKAAVAEYYRRKPLAWESARKALASPTGTILEQHKP